MNIAKRFLMKMEQKELKIPKWIDVIIKINEKKEKARKQSPPVANEKDNTN